MLYAKIYISLLVSFEGPLPIFLQDSYQFIKLVAKSCTKTFVCLHNKEMFI